MCETIPLAEVERQISRWRAMADRIEKNDSLRHDLAAEAYRTCANRLAGVVIRVANSQVGAGSQAIPQGIVSEEAAKEGAVGGAYARISGIGQLS